MALDVDAIREVVRSGTGGIVSDEALVQQWLKKEYPKIKAMAQKVEAEIYFGDAAHIRSDAHDAAADPDAVDEKPHRNRCRMLAAS